MNTIILNSGGSFSVDDYWYPSRTSSFSITLPQKCTLNITVTAQSNSILWIDVNGSTKARIYSKGTYTITSLDAGTYTIGIGANIASGSSSGSVTWTQITAVPVN